MFASGPDEFQFYLGQPDQRCIAFLRLAFASSHGRYSWRRYYVACAADGTVLSQMAAHHYRDARFDDLHEVGMMLRLFGLRQAPAILRRGAILACELPAPKRGQTLLTSIATDEQARGTGIFTRMLAHALTSGWLRSTPGNQYLLDVLLTNTHARRLYERLGFAAQPRQAPPHPRLPAELVATRMAWSGQGIAALREQAEAIR
jgi:ribosomal protein S18 acetylase RimI-like enzyme